MVVSERTQKKSRVTELCLVLAVTKMTLELGCGSFGSVRRVTASGGVDTALKLFVRPEEGVTYDTVRELAAYHMLPLHDNLVQKLDVVWGNPMGLLMPMASTTLKSFRKSNCAVELLTGVVRGICHLHTHDIMHRDLKPDNVLVFCDQGYTAKLCDLGASRLDAKGRCNSLEVCTIWYRPPEMVLKNRFYDRSVDLWSLGLVALEMATGHALCKGGDDAEQMLEYIRLLGTPRPSDGYALRLSWPQTNGTQYEEVCTLNSTAYIIAKRCLLYKASDRTTAHELLDVIEPTRDSAPATASMDDGAADATELTSVALARRPLLIDVMFGTMVICDFSRCSLHASVFLLDRLLQEDEEPSIVCAIASVWCASKLIDSECSSAEDVVERMSAYVKDVAELVYAEFHVLRIVGFDLWTLCREVHSEAYTTLLSDDDTVDTCLLLYPRKRDSELLALTTEERGQARATFGLDERLEFFRRAFCEPEVDDTHAKRARRLKDMHNSGSLKRIKSVNGALSSRMPSLS